MGLSKGAREYPIKFSRLFHQDYNARTQLNENRTNKKESKVLNREEETKKIILVEKIQG